MHWYRINYEYSFTYIHRMYFQNRIWFILTEQENDVKYTLVSNITLFRFDINWRVDSIFFRKNVFVANVDEITKEIKPYCLIIRKMGSSRISKGNHTQFSFDSTRWENQSIPATIILILSNDYAEQLIPLKYFVIHMNVLIICHKFTKKSPFSAFSMIYAKVLYHVFMT